MEHLGDRMDGVMGWMVFLCPENPWDVIVGVKLPPVLSFFFGASIGEPDKKVRSRRLEDVFSYVSLMTFQQTWFLLEGAFIGQF